MAQANTSKSHVVVGMSGGVDSSVAAHLLLEAGYQVTGLFMKNWEEDDGTEYCTAIADLEDAQRACDTLGIELQTANFAAEYWDNVFADFLEDYQANRTPNPDVLCNREIKFKQFARYANLLGGDFIATGHYARITHKAGTPRLLKAADSNKDQTYFLQAVASSQLANVLFPLGDWQKSEVRKRARQLGLANHNRKDSTGICFIGERRFADFLTRYITDSPGPMVDELGVTVGEHRGLHQYTLGQRQGLGIGGLAGRNEAAWYVVAKQADNNTLVVSQSAQLLQGSWLLADQANWLEKVELPLTCQAKIRYRQADQSCRVWPVSAHRYLVEFMQPQRAITPGQHIAFYQDDILLGGATIQSTAQPRAHRITRANRKSKVQ